MSAFAALQYKEAAPIQEWRPLLHVGAYGGYGVVNGAYKNDGQTAQARLTLGISAFTYKNLLIGAELGIQSGNTMRLKASSAIISASGDLPIQSTLKPLLDLLITLKTQLVADRPLFGIAKGGIAYRQLQLNDRTSSSDSLQKINGELQIGLGYNLTQQLMLTAFYQGIYANGSAGVSIDASGDNTYIKHIPTQQAGFLGLEYAV